MGWLLCSTNALDLILLVKVLPNKVGVTLARRYKYIDIDEYELDRDKNKKVYGNTYRG